MHARQPWSTSVHTSMMQRRGKARERKEKKKMPGSFRNWMPCMYIYSLTYYIHACTRTTYLVVSQSLAPSSPLSTRSAQLKSPLSKYHCRPTRWRRAGKKVSKTSRGKKRVCNRAYFTSPRAVFVHAPRCTKQSCRTDWGKKKKKKKIRRNGQNLCSLHPRTTSKCAVPPPSPLETRVL